jgi:predicted nucleotide-binding protein (sugar kinase/HSP70/actin superfamily)
MFIEINQVDCYWDSKDNSNNYYMVGPILVNTDKISRVSISNWLTKHNNPTEVVPNSLRYRIYFDNDNYVSTDAKSYDKIKKYMENCLINE